MKNICRTKLYYIIGRKVTWVIGAYMVSKKDKSEGRGWFIELYMGEKNLRGNPRRL